MIHGTVQYVDLRRKLCTYAGMMLRFNSPIVKTKRHVTRNVTFHKRHISQTSHFTKHHVFLTKRHVFSRITIFPT